MAVTNIFVLVILIIFNVINAQINGEFWWLNDKFKSLKANKVPDAKYEDLNDFENDENDMIVFRDNAEIINSDNKLEINKYIKVNNPNVTNNSEELSLDLHFPGFNVSNITLTKTNVKDYNNVTEKLILGRNKSHSESTNQLSQIKTSGGFQIISFSEQFNDILNVHKKAQDLKYNSTLIDKFDQSYEHINNLNPDVEEICVWVTKDECVSKKGLIYDKSKRKLRNCRNKEFVCCILTNMPTEKLSKIIFKEEKSLESKIESDTSYKVRFPRSTRDNLFTKRDQIQRDNLLRKVFMNRRPSTTASTKFIKKIVNPDYDSYGDPYWNVKNSNTNSPTKNGKPLNSYYYDSVEFEEDYTSEIPTPGGLLGTYSGQSSNRPFNWMDVKKNNAPTYQGYGNSAGSSYNVYSTINPRIDSRRPRPTKASSKDIDDTKSQIVTYEADPDFQVLDGYKLLYYSNKDHKQQTTTEKYPYGVDTDDYDVVYDDVDDLRKNPEENCGQASLTFDSKNGDNEEYDFGKHPWLVLVVRTKKQDHFLCSATLVHQRAAITTASCVYGASPGQVVVRAGKWDLSLSSTSQQQRLASVHTHALYQPGDIQRDMAVLFWKRPLRLTPAVQPVCLDNIREGDTCSLAGWGGFDQAIRARPREQRIKKLPRRECVEAVVDDVDIDSIPNDAFCIRTQSHGCVSGLGSALLCKRNGRMYAAGITVWRERCDKSPILLISINVWTKRILMKLGID